MPTLVSMSLAGRRVSRNDARAIADTAALGRPHLVWNVDDRLLFSLADDAEPTLTLPVANAMNVHVRSQTFRELQELGHAYGESEVRFRWQALTPTTFRHRQHNHPAPDVPSFLGSLAEHWNSHAGNNHPIAAHRVSGLAREAMVLALSGRTLTVDCDAADPDPPDGGLVGVGGETAGFVGTVEARINSGHDSAALADVVTLLHAAEYLGVGLHRDHGMGCARVEILAPLHQPSGPASRKGSRRAQGPR